MVEQAKISNVNPGKRVIYYDVLNILAAINVVWIHFGNEVHWYDGSRVWMWCASIQVLAYWAVPVFFMLTGATLMNYQAKYDTMTFFKRRMLRGIIPYLIWGTFMLALQIKRGNIHIPLDGDIRKMLFIILDIFVNNRMESIYWFFLVLFGIYLSMPILTLLTKSENRTVLDYTVAVGALTVSILPFCYRMLQTYCYLDGSGWNSALQLPILGSYLIYPVLGYWASTHNFSTVERGICYTAAILCAILRYTGLVYLCKRDGSTNQLYFDYLSFPSLFLALGVFVFIRYLFAERIVCKEKTAKFLAAISGCSLGVYLIHNIVLNKIAGIAFFAIYSLQWYFFWPLICYLFCLVIVYAVRKIPLLKYLFP
ncbi:acyltransferase [Caproiciproducens sp. R1]|uniref:acyltransferase n=1 Tax=Caproiciproducens sp. R1 TaxID=3435000 RepID=UPI004034ED35